MADQYIDRNVKKQDQPLQTLSYCEITMLRPVGRWLNLHEIEWLILVKSATKAQVNIVLMLMDGESTPQSQEEAEYLLRTSTENSTTDS